jgi:hypothetical protein
MKLDIELLEDILNKLWLKPLEELKGLFFEENNRVLLQKYNIDLSSFTHGQPQGIQKKRFWKWLGWWVWK